MKILFVGFNAKYINPTNQLIPRMLKLFADVVLFGPGFVSDDELNRGLSAFAEAHGPFDFIATTTQLVVDSNPDTTEHFYRRYSLLQWSKASISPFMTDVKHYMRSSPLPKVAFVMDLDTFGISAALLSQLNQFSDYIVTWGKGFTRPNSELPYMELESAYKGKAKIVPLGLWYDFCESNSHKFINIAHFVGVHEFDFTSTALRSYDVSVAGQLYYSRERTLDLLKKNKKLRVGSTGYRFIFSLLTKIGWSPYSRFIPHTIYRALFKRVLCQSKVSMTDGAAYDAAIRKFMEIPASGALLLARPCVGFESLGFRDGESAVLLDENDPAGQVLRLIADPARLQAIAAKGQEVVWRNHSIQARAHQMERSFNRILEGRFAGSAWRDGEFIFLE
ncbi:MAG: glycosyltransferase family 1 protein [Polaromonas sp.]|uniref:glycosyltransferase n=1 Tax=Polaromonas sp. TaxID=1869339 RepID=UPI0025E6F778|nr:glycosyltransferase [Polaromonas sp.]MBI2725895.1 glycosyltransferase family 1 protein [Polaromonas sp.]